MGNTMMEIAVSNIHDLSDLLSGLKRREVARLEQRRRMIGAAFDWNASALSRALADCGEDWCPRTCRRWLDGDTRPDPVAWGTAYRLARFYRRRERNAQTRRRSG